MRMCRESPLTAISSTRISSSALYTFMIYPCPGTWESVKLNGSCWDSESSSLASQSPRAKASDFSFLQAISNSVSSNTGVQILVILANFCPKVENPQQSRGHTSPHDHYLR